MNPALVAAPAVRSRSVADLRLVPVSGDPLARLLQPERSVTLAAAAPAAEPVWLQSGAWRLFARPGREGQGTELERFELDDGRVLSARWNADDGLLSLPFAPGEAYGNYIAERWQAGNGAGLSSRQLGLYYAVKRFIPRSVQLALRRRLIRSRQLPEFPAWPYEHGVERLVRFYARCLLLALGETELRFRWFWPDSHQAAMTLTHDVESEEGLRKTVELADLEEERGLRSSFNIVGRWYPIDRGIVRELAGRGFELGVHGVYHDRSMFASREAFEQQLPVVRETAAELGAVGFRSPATHRVQDWLGDLPVAYDCSVPHSDPYEPQPGGCCSPWPFFVGDVVELPWTMAQDHTLFTLLGHESIDLWRGQLERLEAAHGLVQLLTHPDPGYLGDPKKRDFYREFLDVVSERPGLWRALPREVAEWWRNRDAGRDDRIAQGTLRLADDDAVIEPPGYAA